MNWIIYIPGTVVFTIQCNLAAKIFTCSGLIRRLEKINTEPTDVKLINSDKIFVNKSYRFKKLHKIKKTQTFAIYKLFYISFLSCKVFPRNYWILYTISCGIIRGSRKLFKGDGGGVRIKRGEATLIIRNQAKKKALFPKSWNS